MNIRKEILDEMLQECKTPPDLFGEGGILKQLTTALVERALEAELSTHLGYTKHESRPGDDSRRRSYRDVQMKELFQRIAPTLQGKNNLPPLDKTTLVLYNAA